MMKLHSCKCSRRQSAVPFCSSRSAAEKASSVSSLPTDSLLSNHLTSGVAPARANSGSRSEILQDPSSLKPCPTRGAARKATKQAWTCLRGSGFNLLRNFSTAPRSPTVAAAAIPSRTTSSNRPVRKNLSRRCRWWQLTATRNAVVPRPSLALTSARALSRSSTVVLHPWEAAACKGGRSTGTSSSVQSAEHSEFSSSFRRLLTSSASCRDSWERRAKLLDSRRRQAAGRGACPQGRGLLTSAFSRINSCAQSKEPAMIAADKAVVPLLFLVFTSARNRINVWAHITTSGLGLAVTASHSGVASCLSVSSTSAPRAKSITTFSAIPACTATCRGVRPSLSVWRRSAPKSINMLTTAGTASPWRPEATKIGAGTPPTSSWLRRKSALYSFSIRSICRKSSSWSCRLWHACCTAKLTALWPLCGCSSPRLRSMDGLTPASGSHRASNSRFKSSGAPVHTAWRRRKPASSAWGAGDMTIVNSCAWRSMSSSSQDF
mmetsp:Transcript_178/g.425  ORF Transcript_178/g.425 Transcript_178/m.425 type:complete len:492 (+) Transcript_178:477-1952(+)